MKIHQPVLLNEVTEWILTNSEGFYLDCTVGHGGHFFEILKNISSRGFLLGIDQDKNALNYVQKKLNQQKNRNFKLVLNNFVNLKNITKNNQIPKFDGILYDLGFSYEQIYSANRGFSYAVNAPLDMRMNMNQSLTAKEIVNTYSLSELNNLFKHYGEIEFSYIFAQKIVDERKKYPIHTTFDLIKIIQSCLNKQKNNRKDFIRLIFQSLRIAVNNELAVLEKSLVQAIDLLKIKGRILVISFHSLEDRIVKKVFKSQKNIKILNKKPILATTKERLINLSARSAKLRIAEKTDEK